MELKNSSEIEMINARIGDLKSQLETATDESKKRIGDEIRSLEAKRDQVVAYADREEEKVEKNFEGLI